MKLLQLISSRIRQYWAGNRLIFILFLAGGILCSVMFTYFYGNMLSYMQYITSDDPYYRTYDVALTEAMGSDIPRPEYEISLDDAQRLYEHDLVEAVTVQWLFEIFDADAVQGDSWYMSMAIIAEFGDDPDITLDMGSKDLGAEPYTVVVPYDSNAVVGDTIEICGKELKVIGKHNLSDYYVSCDFFREIGAIVDRMTVVSADRLDLSNDPLMVLLEEMFPECYLRSPVRWENAYERRMTEELLFMLCPVYGVSLVSFMFLLRYLMDAILNNTIVSRIVGARKTQIFGMCFIESVALCAVVDAAGIGIHWLLYDSVFSKLNALQNLIYRPEDYLRVYLCMLGVGMAVAALFVRKYAKLSPAASRRHIG